MNREFKLKKSESRSWVPNHHTILISKWLLLLCYIEGKDQAAAYKSSPGSQGWWLFPDGLADEASCHLPLLRRLGSPSYFWPTSFYAKLSWLEVITKVMLKQVLKTGLCPIPWRCPTSAQYGAISRTSCWHSCLTFGWPNWHPFSPGILAELQTWWWICLTL